MARAASGVAVASITLWELALRFVRGRIELQGSLTSAVAEVMAAAGASALPSSAEVAALAAEFPPGYPRDPADRLIGATALAEHLPLVTSDRAIRASGLVPTIW